jgi:hypothetical protein
MFREYAHLNIGTNCIMFESSLQNVLFLFFFCFFFPFSNQIYWNFWSFLFSGSTYKNECPQKHMLTIYLSVGGGSGLLKLAFILLRHRKSPNYESLDDTDQDGDGSGDAVLSRSIKFTDCMLNIFIIVWFILGNEWYYAKPSPNFEQTLHEPNNWCDQFLYRYYFYILIFSYISFSFIAFYILTLCFYYYKQNGMRLCKPILVI